MRAMLPACGSWRCGGIALVFRLAIVFGRGRTTNSKPACKSGLAGMERMRSTCSGKIEMPNVATWDSAGQLSLGPSGEGYSGAFGWVASPFEKVRGMVMVLMFCGYDT